MTLPGAAPVTVLVATPGGLAPKLITASQFPASFAAGVISPFFEILGPPAPGLLELFQP